MTFSRAMKSIVAGSIALIVVLGISSCAAARDTSSNSFRVAIIADLTGPLAPIIATGMNGGLTLIDLVNDRGGVDGTRPIEITGTYDSASTAEGGTVAVRKALGDEPDLILAFAGSSPTEAFVPVLNRQPIPTIGIFTNAALAFPPGNYWGLLPAEPQQAQFALRSAQEILGDVKGARIAYEHLDTPGAEATSKKVRATFEAAGAETVHSAVMQFSATSFASAAAAIADLDPDLFVVSDGAANLTTAIPAVRAAGWKGPVLMAGDSANSESDFAAIDDADYYASRAYLPALTGTEMADAAKKFDHDVSSFFSYGWSATDAAVAVLGECDDECSPETLSELIDGLGKFNPRGDSASGPLLFARGGRTVVTTSKLFRWDDAKKRTVQVGDSQVVQPKKSY